MALAQIAYFGHLVATALGVVAVLRLTRRSPQPAWASALLAAGCLALALASFRVSDPSWFSDDFYKAYYPAGQAALGDPGRLGALSAQGVSGFVNMPVAAYLFAPFGALPMKPAALAFLAVGLAMTLAAWALLVGLARLGRAEAWLLALLFAANGPLHYSLKEGNSSHMVLFALVAGLALLRAERPGLAGAVVGAAAVIKPPLLVFGGFFLLRRDLRGLAGFGGLIAATAALSVALFGLDENLRWFDRCVLQFSHRWLAAFNVQSIPGFLFRLQAPAAYLRDWNAYPPPAGLALAARLCLLGLGLVAGLAVLRPRTAADDAVRRGRRRELQFMLVLALAVIASPLSWSHYYCWLLVPTAFFLAERRRRPAVERALGWTAIALTTPLARPLAFASEGLTLAYKTVAVSHLLFAGLLWFGLIAWRLSREDGLVGAWLARQEAGRATAQMTWRRSPGAGTVP
jgi:hypothetical protein